MHKASSVCSVNTVVTLLYTDADNYKQYSKICLSGEISSSLRERLRKALARDEGIIAHQIGLPTPSEQAASYDSFPNDDIDHVWTTIAEIDHDEPFGTTREGEPLMSTLEFVQRIETAVWDVKAEWERLKSEFEVESSSYDCAQPSLIADV